MAVSGHTSLPRQFNSMTGIPHCLQQGLVQVQLQQQLLTEEMILMGERIEYFNWTSFLMMNKLFERQLESCLIAEYDQRFQDQLLMCQQMLMGGV